MEPLLKMKDEIAQTKYSSNKITYN